MEERKKNFSVGQSKAILCFVLVNTHYFQERLVNGFEFAKQICVAPFTSFYGSNKKQWLLGYPLSRISRSHCKKVLE